MREHSHSDQCFSNDTHSDGSNDPRSSHLMNKVHSEFTTPWQLGFLSPSSRDSSHQI
jgi:hypothetical protein